jgi:hypothetical protein
MGNRPDPSYNGVAVIFRSDAKAIPAIPAK